MAGCRVRDQVWSYDLKSAVGQMDKVDVEEARDVRVRTGLDDGDRALNVPGIEKLREHLGETGFECAEVVWVTRSATVGWSDWLGVLCRLWSDIDFVAVGPNDDLTPPCEEIVVGDGARVVQGELASDCIAEFRHHALHAEPVEGEEIWFGKGCVCSQHGGLITKPRCKRAAGIGGDRSEG